MNTSEIAPSSEPAVSALDLGDLRFKATRKLWDEIISFLDSATHEVRKEALGPLDGVGATLLHHAAAQSQDSLVHTAVCRLIEMGAEVNARDNGAQTPMHWAASRNAGFACTHLARSGAVVDAQDDVGETPLFGAVMNVKLQAAAALMKAGANLNVANSRGSSAEEWINADPRMVALMDAMKASNAIELAMEHSAQAIATTFQPKAAARSSP